MFLPTSNIIPSDLHITDWTILQINMMIMIEHRKMEMMAGGENANGR